MREILKNDFLDSINAAIRKVIRRVPYFKKPKERLYFKNISTYASQSAFGLIFKKRRKKYKLTQSPGMLKQYRLVRFIRETHTFCRNALYNHVYTKRINNPVKNQYHLGNMKSSLEIVSWEHKNEFGRQMVI